jgi:BlaI family transcriptional regulator, penicillinase repressor
MSSRRKSPDAVAAGSRRERQIMDIVYRLGSASAAEIRAQMADPPTYTTVRGLLRILAGKGRLEIKRSGARYVYSPTVAPGAAGKAMIAHVARTFFDGSPSRALSALLGDPEIRLTDEEVERLQAIIDRHEGKSGPP